MKYYKQVLQKYATFSGRARRSEYWYFVLFNIIFAIAAIILDILLGLAWQGVGYGPIYGLYLLATIIPSIAVAVRRLHDVGKSGWFLLIALIPIIGAIWLLVLYCKEGDKGSNDYGADPKGEGMEVSDHLMNQA